MGLLAAFPSLSSPAAEHSAADLPQPAFLKSRRDAVEMPVDMNGYWKMISNDNFEEYMKALGEFTLGQPYLDLIK